MRILFSAFFLISYLCSSAYSDEQQIIAMGDIEFGEYLAGECSACHHQAGLSKGIPAINGLDAEVFVTLMVAYRSKEMEHPVMQMIAGRLDDEQIGSLALYFSKLDPPK